MAEIGAELRHLAVDIEPGAMPVDDGAHGEGVAQIMDARAMTMTVVSLSVAKSGRLADIGKGVARATIAGALAVLEVEQGAARGAEDAVAVLHVGAQMPSRVRGDREQPVAPDLAGAHVDRGLRQIDIRVVQVQRLVDPQPCRGDQAEERGVGRAAQAVGRLQPPGRGEKRRKFRLREDMQFAAPHAG